MLNAIVTLRTGTTVEDIRRIVATRTDLVRGIRPGEPTTGPEFFAHSQATGAVIVTPGGQRRWADPEAQRTYLLLRSREWMEQIRAKRRLGRHMRRKRGATP